MAITYVSAAEDVYNSGTSVGSRTVSVNIGTRTNGLLVVGIAIFDASAASPDVSTVTYAGVSLSKAVDRVQTNGTTDYITELWYLTDPTDGTNDLVVTFAATNVGISEIIASWYDGAHQTQGSVLGNTNSGVGTTDPSVSITPPENDCLIVSQYCSEANNELTVGSGETKILGEDWGGQVAGGSYVIQTTVGAQTVDWSGTDAYWSMCVASFKKLSGTTYYETPSGAITPSGTVALRTNKPLSGSITPSGTVSNSVRKVLSGTLTSAGEVARRTYKTMSGELTPSGVVNAIKVAFVTVGGALTMAGTLVLQTGKSLVGALTPSGEVARSTSKTTSGALTPSGEVARSTTKSMSGGITPAGVVTTIKLALVSVGGTLTMAGTVVLRTSKSLAGTLTPAGVVDAVKQAGSVILVIHDAFHAHWADGPLSWVSFQRMEAWWIMLKRWRMERIRNRRRKNY